MNRSMLVTWDGLDDALVGYVMTRDCESIAVYSYNKAIAFLEQQGFTREDALEHLHFNLIEAYVGEYTPLWLYSDEPETTDAMIS